MPRPVVTHGFFVRPRQIELFGDHAVVEEVLAILLERSAFSYRQTRQHCKRPAAAMMTSADLEGRLGDAAGLRANPEQ